MTTGLDRKAMNEVEGRTLRHMLVILAKETNLARTAK